VNTLTRPELQALRALRTATEAAAADALSGPAAAPRTRVSCLDREHGRGILRQHGLMA
jgi:hypothetical protein